MFIVYNEIQTNTRVNWNELLFKCSSDIWPVVGEMRQTE